MEWCCSVRLWSIFRRILTSNSDAVIFTSILGSRYQGPTSGSGPKHCIQSEWKRSCWETWSCRPRIRQHFPEEVLRDEAGDEPSHEGRPTASGSRKNQTKDRRRLLKSKHSQRNARGPSEVIILNRHSFILTLFTQEQELCPMYDHAASGW